MEFTYGTNIGWFELAPWLRSGWDSTGVFTPFVVSTKGKPNESLGWTEHPKRNGQVCHICQSARVAKNVLATVWKVEDKRSIRHSTLDVTCSYQDTQLLGEWYHGDVLEHKQSQYVVTMIDGNPRLMRLRKHINWHCNSFGITETVLQHLVQTAKILQVEESNESHVRVVPKQSRHIGYYLGETLRSRLDQHLMDLSVGGLLRAQEMPDPLALVQAAVYYARLRKAKLAGLLDEQFQIDSSLTVTDLKGHDGDELAKMRRFYEPKFFLVYDYSLGDGLKRWYVLRPTKSKEVRLPARFLNRPEVRKQVEELVREQDIVPITIHR